MKRLIVTLAAVSMLAACSGPVSTLDVAILVKNKGAEIVDVQNYRGMIYLYGVSELALESGSEEMQKEIVSTIAKFGTGELKGVGNFVNYEFGGTALPFLVWKGFDSLKEMSAVAADSMWRTQPKSLEGIMMARNREPEKNPVFIDPAFAVTPFFLYAGLTEGNPDYVDYAVFETLELVKILKDPVTGLVHQGRGCRNLEAGEFSQDNWSRGNGWAAVGLASLLRDLPADHPSRPEVEKVACEFIADMLKCQDGKGMWHQEMSDFSSFPETSGSALMLYIAGVAVEKGYLDASCKENITRGLKGLLKYIGEDGSLDNVCKECWIPEKGTKEDYKNREYAHNDPHGFGPVILAFTQAHRIGIETI